MRKQLIAVKRSLLERGIKAIQAAQEMGINNSRFSLFLNGWAIPDEVTKRKMMEYFPDAVAELSMV